MRRNQLFAVFVNGKLDPQSIFDTKEAAEKCVSEKVELAVYTEGLERERCHLKQIDGEELRQEYRGTFTVRSLSIYADD